MSLCSNRVATYCDENILDFKPFGIRSKSSLGEAKPSVPLKNCHTLQSKALIRSWTTYV